MRDPAQRHTAWSCGYGGRGTFTDELAALSVTLSEGALTTEPATMEAYRRDWTQSETAGMPLGVVRARRAEDVVATLRWASARGVPVVPRGAGSGLSGGSCAVDGCIVLSLVRMRAVEIDPATRTATVQPDLNRRVKAALDPQGILNPGAGI